MTTEKNSKLSRVWWCEKVNGLLNIQVVLRCVVFVFIHGSGVPKEASAQTGSGFLPAETSSAPYQVPTPAEGGRKHEHTLHTLHTETIEDSESMVCWAHSGVTEHILRVQWRSSVSVCVCVLYRSCWSTASVVRGSLSCRVRWLQCWTCSSQLMILCTRSPSQDMRWALCTCSVMLYTGRHSCMLMLSCISIVYVQD